MNLRDRAEADLEYLLEDSESGFASEITFTIPAVDVYTDPVVVKVNGIVNRIGVYIDQDTGLSVQGDTSAITVRLSSLPSEPKQSWLVSFSDITGNIITGKILKPMLDKTLGKATFFLKRGS